MEAAAGIVGVVLAVAGINDFIQTTRRRRRYRDLDSKISDRPDPFRLVQLTESRGSNEPAFDICLIPSAFHQNSRVWQCAEHTDCSWTTDHLAKDPQLPGEPRILRYYYEETLTSSSSLFEQTLYYNAAQLLEKLSDTRSSDPERPLLFITDKLGGLLLKSALILANDIIPSAAPIDGRKIFLATAGIIFFQVPEIDQVLTKKFQRKDIFSILESLELPENHRENFRENGDKHFKKTLQTLAWRLDRYKAISKMIPELQMKGKIDEKVDVPALSKHIAGWIRAAKPSKPMVSPLGSPMGSPIPREIDHFSDISKTTGYSPILPQAENEFVGSDGSLEGLMDLLETKRRVAVFGPAGCGKTRLVTELCKRNVKGYKPIFWIHADSKLTLVASFLRIGQQICQCLDKDATGLALDLNICDPEPELVPPVENDSMLSDEDHMAVVNSVLEWLSRSENSTWLLVYDNVQNSDSDSIWDFLPVASSKHGHVLMTCRKVDGQSKQMLNFTARASWETHTAPAFFGPIRDHRRSMSSGFQGQSFGSKFELFELPKNANDQRKDSKDRFGPELPRATVNGGGSKFVYRMNDLAARANNSNTLLQQCQNLGKRIDLWLEERHLLPEVQTCMELEKIHSDQVPDDEDWTPIADLCRRHGRHREAVAIYLLIEQHTKKKKDRFELNMSCSMLMNERCLSETRRSRLKAIASSVQKSAEGQSIAPQPKLGLQRRPSNLSEQADLGVNALELQVLEASLDNNWGTAIRISKTLSDFLEDTEGDDGPGVLQALRRLAFLQMDHGRQNEASLVLQRIVITYNRTLGMDHTRTLRAFEALALAYREEGDLRRALDAYKIVIEKKQERLGKNHIDVCKTLANRAVCYYMMDDLKTARMEYSVVLRRIKDFVGDCFPEAVSSLEETTLDFALSKRLKLNVNDIK